MMPRRNISKYDPAAESSPGMKNEAKKAGQLWIALESRGEGAGLSCLCGCGKMPAGKRSLFAMGHDARLRGMLQRAHLTETEVVLVVDGDEHAPQTAMEIAAEQKWERYLEQAESAREGKNREVLNKAMGSERLVKIGRWEYTGQVVAIYNSGEEDQYKVEYVTRTGEVRHTTVKASEAKEMGV